MISELIDDETKAIPKGIYDGLRMTKEGFLTWQPGQDELFVYEFNNGTIESTPGMRQDEARIVKRIIRGFSQTAAYSKGSELFTEFDCWVTETQMRRPDLALYRNEQINRMNAQGREIPSFVIEVISEYDEFGKMNAKLREYFAADVQVVWWVVPVFKMVYVFTSPKTVVIATDQDSLNAGAALSDLQLTVEEIFRV